MLYREIRRLHQNRPNSFAHLLFSVAKISIPIFEFSNCIYFISSLMFLSPFHLEWFTRRVGMINDSPYLSHILRETLGKKSYRDTSAKVKLFAVLISDNIELQSIGSIQVLHSFYQSISSTMWKLQICSVCLTSWDVFSSNE